MARLSLLVVFFVALLVAAVHTTEAEVPQIASFGEFA